MRRHGAELYLGHVFEPDRAIRWRLQNQLAERA